MFQKVFFFFEDLQPYLSFCVPVLFVLNFNILGSKTVHSLLQNQS